MRTTIFLFTTALSVFLLPVARAQNGFSALSNVTLGFGAGYYLGLNDVEEYSLTPDDLHRLRVESASRGAFVISSVVSVRLGRVSTFRNSNRLYSQRRIGALASEGRNFRFLGNRNAVAAAPKERWCLNLALNLAEVNGDAGLAFNKSIDGGLGVGYYLTDVIQCGVFFDIQRVRQLRRHIVDEFRNASIPLGADVYTSLDPADNVLFTTRTFPGLSFKLIYALPNKE